MNQLDIHQDKVFFHLPGKRHPKDNSYKHENTVDGITQKQTFDKKGDLIREYSLETYKKKYTILFLDLYKKKNVDLTKKVFNYNKPVHSLSLSVDNLDKISYLPPELLSLWMQGVGEHAGWGFDLKVIPKSLVSISYRWSPFNMNGWDISSLKNLKIFSADYNPTAYILPKFPKDIEYINFKNGMIRDSGLKFFNILDYPKLKYFNVSGNIISKIPKEWLQLKKDKKLKIFFGSQKKFKQ